MQERIGKRRLMAKIRSLGQKRLQRVSGRKRTERTDEIPNLSVGGVNPHSPAELLQHVDTGPPVGGIHHELDCSVRIEYAVQCPETSARIGEMMKNSRAYDLVEFSSQIAYLFQSELVHLKILQVILLLQLPGALHASCADIDPGDSGLRPAQSLLRRLRCSAAGN